MEKLYTNLLAQAEKLRRHNRQGSYKTKSRYFEAYKRFLRHLASVYRLQKLQNISGKHLSSYIKHLQNKDLAASTIKTDLAAIRFWHDKISDAKYSLPENREFCLERRQFGKVDRTWSNREYNLMIAEAMKAGRDGFVACIVLARHVGLRIHECLRIDTATARNALKTGDLTIKGKNGLIRSVPINEPARIMLEKSLKFVSAGEKLFVPNDVQTHVVKAELQQFIREHRKLVQDGNSAKPLTFHGLRHTFAAEMFSNLIIEGKSEIEAKRQVSALLGHRRAEVTNVYLASLRSEDNGGEVGENKAGEADV